MFTDYYQVRDWLEGFIPLVYGKEELGLKRIEYLITLLGNPHNKFKSIHIAGTSGKGSTAFYTARLLQAAGYKVGLHISPHLVDIRERMQIQGKSILPLRLIRLMSHIRSIVESMKDSVVGLPSYFEILVAASFLYFAEERIDYAVVEVGLGGRLDATNVVEPEVSVITNIGLDHTEILGDTVEKIAYEKAGIIKNGVPVVTGASGKALGVIKDVAKEKGAKVVNVSRVTGHVSSDIEDYLRLYKDIDRHIGAMPIFNFLLPIAAVSELGISISKKAIKESFSQNFPGRFEEMEEGVVIDGAHNPDKIKALIGWIKKTYGVRHSRKSGNLDPRIREDDTEEDSKVTLVIAFKKGKQWGKMVDLLLNNLAVIKVISTQFYTVTDTDKFAAVPAEQIAGYIKSKWKVKVESIKNSHEAVMEALIPDVILTLSEANGEGSQNRDSSSTSSPQNDNKALVLITGSLYLVGEVRTIWYLPTFA